ncbi:amidohydrolase family protein [Phaeobacter marinintestinus]|uniref:amidohydrolase family protein n=1 Tax=Falsiphaeobacter marinintestinus TaxID=1492905 RepID=UPI0011B5D275|nr:amidohydrolase family protein [Phaeobacter marinintestinus]
MDQRDDWLAQVREDIIDPEREIVDPHHHLWARAASVYEMDRLRDDTGSGHNVVQTMFIECREYYDTDADPFFAPVGETRAVAEMAQSCPPGKARLSGIIAHADLRNPDLNAVLDAHLKAGQGLLRGIRHSGAFDPEPETLAIPARGVPGQYLDPDFRRGLALLGERGLTYDTWHYHHQAADFLDMVQAVPSTTIILDHFGTPLGVGRFAGKRDEIFEQWKQDMAALAECPNVFAKLGGLTMPDNGWGWHLAERPPTSDEFVAAQGDYYHHMVDMFGPERCMFESNFPVDRTGIGYHVLWNGFKKIAERYDGAAHDALFAGTARQVYNLSP